MKKRIVSIICILAMMLSMSTLGMLSASAANTVLSESEFKDITPVENLDYSFAILGDIQTITNKAKKDNTYKGLANIFSWLTDNQEERKIEYVIGLGDTIDTLYTYPESYNPVYSNRVEWEKARANFKKLNGIIPYMVVRGNHDDEDGYHKYICTDEYQEQILKDANGNEVGGFYYDSTKMATMGNSMSNSYRKLEIGNHKYLMLGLDFSIGDADAGDDVLEWACGVVEANPDYKVIVSIHAYVGGNGVRMQGQEIQQTNGERTETEGFKFYGNKIWQQLVRKYENMFMVFSGHVSVDNPVVSRDTGDNGNEIINILVDPQSTYSIDPTTEQQVPLAAIFMMNVTNGGKVLEFEYIDADRDKQIKTRNRFSIELPEGTFPEFDPTPVTEAEETTEAETTEAPATTEEAKKRGCKGSITSTVAICCAMGTTLAAFAMRKKKED